MRHTEQQVKEAIQNIPNLDTEDLVHQLKCASSIADAKSKNLYKPFISACEKELKSRQKTVSEEPADDSETN